MWLFPINRFVLVVEINRQFTFTINWLFSVIAHIVWAISYENHTHNFVNIRVSLNPLISLYDVIYGGII